jgi:pyruvate/2-oxoacid:ferredoxin oxidoreductase beta subunit/Pyruvate/2-oxoacid:ferredoxin oxidoreductase gamma subunit
MTDRVGKLPFCPGCGHHVLINSLNKALVKLQLDPKKVVIVTDIGCIGLSDRYFITNAFHGLHGRSITYACGLKLARPDLTVIALKGDGGCGIGGTHLLNVGRRNIGITLIVGNNFNYGMTGGQHSVTTPSDGRTSTTPWGNVEGPMDLCGTAIAAGASCVYRTTTFEKDLVDVLAAAITEPGFALVDVWELCTGYYSARNQLKRKDLEELLKRLGFPLGRLADRHRPEYSARYAEAYEASGAGKKPERRAVIAPAFNSNVRRQTGLVIAGSAGQKVKSTATTFAQGAMFAGLSATQKDDYPITVMTGHSLAEIIVSPERIDYTGIDSPDFFILISEEGLKRTRGTIGKLAETCTLYADQSLELPETRAKVVRRPFLETAKKVDPLSVAVTAMAALLADTGLFPLDAFRAAVSKFQRREIAEVNLKALAAGAELAGAGKEVAKN